MFLLGEIISKNFVIAQIYENLIIRDTFLLKTRTFFRWKTLQN
jgi:hypothetical protein